MLRHIRLIAVTYFTQWFINNFINDDVLMARCDNGSWQKQHSNLNLPFTASKSQKSRDVEIAGAAI